MFRKLIFAGITILALAVPATAASAATSYPQPQPQKGCSSWNDLQQEQWSCCKIKTEWVQDVTWTWRHHHWVRSVRWVEKTVKDCTQFPPGNPNPGGPSQGGNPGKCYPQTITFDFPAGSTTVTEISGPPVRKGDMVTYQGDSYTIGTVTGDTFTVTQGGQVVENDGTSITDGTAETVCSQTS
jgi:hypothetical protein